MSEKRINEELAAVEAALASLKPAISGVDRDRVMFLAGRASVTYTPPRRSRTVKWLWPCITAVSLLTAFISSGILFMQGISSGEKGLAYSESKNIHQIFWYPDKQTETTKFTQPRPRSSSGRDDLAMDYLTLNRLISEKGVEALPGPSWIPIGPEKSTRRYLIMRGDEKIF
jgi:hypothetical protein